MTTVNYVLAALPPRDSNAIAVYTWSPIVNVGDVGQEVNGAGFADRSFQIDGIGGGTVVIEGSNDGINYYTLHDAFANLIIITSAQIVQVTEITLWIRPRLSVGSGLSTKVTGMFCSHLEAR